MSYPLSPVTLQSLRTYAEASSPQCLSLPTSSRPPSLCQPPDLFSRGIIEIDGTDITKVTKHLKSSGLPLLRAALARGQMDETLPATCLIWCLADIFADHRGISTWHVHLQGIEAILQNERAYQQFVVSPGFSHSATRHLYRLYLALQTLPHVPSETSSRLSHGAIAALSKRRNMDAPAAPGSTIDGFLGCSEELLGVLHEASLLPSSEAKDELPTHASADMLLGRINGMILRDAQAPPTVSIAHEISRESGRDFALCHYAYQQAVLILIYRKLYNMPSGSQPVQEAVSAISDTVNKMAQGRQCHAWVAMSMPLFTIGCEAFSSGQKNFVLDKIGDLEKVIGSLHMKIIRQALQETWRMRADRNDTDGKLCSEDLIGQLPYSIILF